MAAGITYCSTRGLRTKMTFEDTLFTGWLENKELTMPENMPVLETSTFEKWEKLDFKELSEEIFFLFAGEDIISRAEYKNILKETYADWPEEIIPIKRLSKNACVFELYNGPSLSFKDVSLAVAGEVLNIALKKAKKHCINYTCTSGDTGSAVIETTKNKSNIDSFIFFPNGNKISNIQRLLMTTQKFKNIHNFDADTGCDPLDSMLIELAERLNVLYPDVVITSLNSVVWLRIMMQTVHIFYGYFRTVNHPQELTLVLPTGGMGHTTSCLIAKKLGLSIKLVTCFNTKNQNTYNFLNGGALQLKADTQTSLSPAIDIQNPTNIGRVIYLFLNGDVEKVKEHMEQYYNGGAMKASVELLTEIQKVIKCNLTSDEEIVATLKKCYEEFDYLIDPHTAVAFSHYYKSDISTPTAYLACASPIKFEEVLNLANIPLPSSYEKYYENLKSKTELVTHLPNDPSNWVNEVLDYIEVVFKNKDISKC